MKRKEKIIATWHALLGLMVQEHFEPTMLVLIGHSENNIAFIKGIPTYKELESPDFHLCDWLINGHIDTAANLEELAEVFKNTRTVICDDIDDPDYVWIVKVTKFRGGNPKARKYKKTEVASLDNPSTAVDGFTLYRCV